jgi:hypothetical protein
VQVLSNFSSERDHITHLAMSLLCLLLLQSYCGAVRACVVLQLLLVVMHS